MISLQIRNQILQLIDNAKKILLLKRRHKVKLSALEYIEQGIILEEFKQEVAALDSMMSNASDDLAAAFKALCAGRAKRIKGTCLSYIAIPEGETNTLYLNIAQALFELQTMGELIGILMPDLSKCLVFELVNRSEVTLNIRTLHEELSMPISNCFGNYIIVRDCLFDVSTIVNFSFPLHQSCYSQLMHCHPDLATALYNRNHAFKMLRQDLELVLAKGLSPKKAIENLITKFRQGGSSQTGQEYANTAAQMAFIDFRAYLASLPNEINKQLLDLSAKFTLDYVINIHLGAEKKCVEEAAVFLQNILDQNKSNDILKKPPILSQQDLKQINLRYSSLNKTPLDIKLVPDIRRKYPSILLSHSLLHFLPSCTTEESLPFAQLILDNRSIEGLAWYQSYFSAFAQLQSSQLAAIDQRIAIHRQLDSLIAQIKRMKPSVNVLHAIQCTSDLLECKISLDTYILEAQKLKSNLRSAMVYTLSALMLGLAFLVGFATVYFLFISLAINPPAIGMFYAVFYGLFTGVASIALMLDPVRKISGFFNCYNRLPEKMDDIAEHFSLIDPLIINCKENNTKDEDLSVILVPS